MKKKLTVLAVACMAFTASKAQTPSEIPHNFFGTNAWMPNQIGDISNNNNLPGQIEHESGYTMCLGGEFDAIAASGKITTGNFKIIRIGGHHGDQDMPTYAQYVQWIDKIRATGAEPLVQISYGDKGYWTSTQAAALVTYLNTTMGKRVKYWEIGNEWDFYSSDLVPGQSYSYNSTTNIIDVYKSWVPAMKLADASIQIVGPSWPILMEVNIVQYYMHLLALVAKYLDTAITTLISWTFIIIPLMVLK
jgi:hypothetical protein